jgi:hypothetical protein
MPMPLAITCCTAGDAVNKSGSPVSSSGKFLIPLNISSIKAVTSHGPYRAAQSHARYHGLGLQGTRVTVMSCVSAMHSNMKHAE